MARTIQSAKIGSRSSRERLKPRREPYWIWVSPGQQVGYRKGAKGGTWIAKITIDGRRPTHSLGAADDTEDADGKDILSYAEALEAARRWFNLKRGGLVADSSAGPFTVEKAMQAYMKDYDARSGKAGDRMRSYIDAHILPDLGSIKVSDLTKHRLVKWHRDLATKPPRLRSRKGSEQRYRDTSDDPEAERRRQSTANRILTILKGALNFCYENSEFPVYEGEAWKTVKPFKKADRAKIRYLTEAETTRLINASQGDVRRLVVAGLLTGARYGEISKALVQDFDPDAKTLHLRETKSGEERHVYLTDEGCKFFEGISAGREPSDRLLVKKDGTAWGRSHQTRPLAEACGRAKISPAIGYHVLRHTFGSRLAMRGVPMTVIADQLGHVSTKITEKHYAHLGPSFVADTIRANLGEFGIDTGNVQAIQ